MIRRSAYISTFLFKKTNVSCKAAVSSISVRAYHSYPDPNEKPVVKTSVSKYEKSIDKATLSLALDSKFKVDTLFPGVPVSKGIGATPPPPTLSTVLDNGLRVASQEMPGLMTSIAILVRTGSAYEDQRDSPDADTGATHFLELNAFRSTKNRSYQDFMVELEKIGGMVQCIGQRENIIYVMDVMRHDAEKAFHLLADTIVNPTFPAEEMEEARNIAELQQTELPSSVFSRELMQRAAYKQASLSNTHYCPTDILNSVDAKRLTRFREKYFYAGNCTLAVAGLDHELAVKLANQAFSGVPAKRDSDGKVIVRKSSDDYDKNGSTYTGGMLTETRELKEPFVKLAMGFEMGGWNDPLLVPACVMQQILGGGSSFSAGGPGKGMFSRLYTQVLNRYYWAESVESFLSIHETKGMMGIDGACGEQDLVNMIQIITQQFTALASVPVPAEELQRAKNMLKSSMMMQLESRLVQCEDIGRQFSVYGFRDSQAEMCAKIDAVTAEDVMKVAQKMMSHPPSIGVVGHDLSQLPPYEQIATYCRNYYAQSKVGSGTFTN